MSVPFISFEDGETVMDWVGLCNALEAGHSLPKAEIADSFLYRDPDTMLNRAAWIDGLGMAVKTATIFPGNRSRNAAAVNGAVCLYSDQDGTLSALIDFHLVTKWKTAADSLLGARKLARPDARHILILGAGTVGQSLIEAFGAGFPGAQITLWNRTPDAAHRCAAHNPGVAVATDLPAAVEAADIIVTATMSSTPVLQGAWLRPGQHVNLIGAYRPDMREADDAALQRSRLYVDSFKTTLDHIGELRIPLETGAISRDAVRADYYDMAGFKRGTPDEITLFKNGGGAHLDLMTSRYILDQWQASRS